MAILLRGLFSPRLILRGAGIGGAPVVTPSIAPFRDRDIYDAILAILGGLGEFDRIEYVEPDGQARVTSESDAWALVQPTGDATVPDGSKTREFHLCSYTLTFGVKSKDLAGRTYATQIDRIMARIRNSIMSPANRSFGGRCIPMYTKLSGGGFASEKPTMARSLKGEFAYSISLAVSSYSTAK